MNHWVKREFDKEGMNCQLISSKRRYVYGQLSVNNDAVLATMSLGYIDSVNV
jgi:hypothetical protein